MPREDILAIKAYLFSLEPVNQPNRENDIGFPFNQRWGIALWNLLFLDDERFEPDPQQSAQWNRGAYLVEGPGHCGECHTPRNFMQAKQSSKALGGATIQGWAAWNITDEQSGIGGWPDDALAAYLAAGVAGLRRGGRADGRSGQPQPAPPHIRGYPGHGRLSKIGASPAGGRETPRSPLTGQSAARRKRAPAGAEALRRRLRQLPPVGRQRRQSDYAALRGLRTLSDPQGLNLVRVILDGDACTGPAGIT